MFLAAVLSPFSAATTRAAPAAAAVTVELQAVEDAGTIQSLPAFNGSGAPYFVLNSRAGGAFDYNFVKFDLSALPANATIDSAQVRLHISAVANDLPIEMGRADGVWDESTLTWNTQPAVAWVGSIQTATVVGDLSWPVKPLLDAWLSGAQDNNGVTLRGVTPNTGGVRADTRDGLQAPVLVVTYTVPDDTEPRPDLGDAPDSSNNLGLNNVAYLDGTLGRFPTVFQVTPAGQPVGPRHANILAGGFLGDYISREIEADSGADQDGVNNILGGGPLVSNRDRGDDGWRNPNANFTNCLRTTLRVRVRRPANGAIARMYLNTWIDGNHDGDWADNNICQPGGEGANRASTEWIVRNHSVDMTAIPAGSFVDIDVNTEFVLNTSPNAAHWARFTLAETPVIPPGGVADGRGPLGGYGAGETEDYLQRNGGPGETGTLTLGKLVTTTADPTEWIDYVTYSIRLRHVGGTQPVEARIQDVLPYPLIVYPVISGGDLSYLTVSSSTGGVTPLSAELDVIPPSGATPPQQVVTWQGTLAPDSEVLLTFQVRVIALCQPNQQTLTIVNTAQARPRGGQVISASDSFTSKCIGYDENDIDITSEPQGDVVDDARGHGQLVGSIANQHPFTVTLGLYEFASQAPALLQVQSANAVQRVTQQLTIGPNQSMPFEMPLSAAHSATDTLSQPIDASPYNTVGYCVLPEGLDVCPDPALFPNLHGVIPFTATLRPNDLGDAPDSSNHAAVAMSAFPAVPANYPTVFDPATGAVQGPRHAFPGPFHLGKRVSREVEADLGPDQDPLNNIRPAANDPDNDRGDDGTNLALWNLNNCQVATVPVRVAISPAAVAWFQQQGTPAYLNIWVDGNRDGDWADFTSCNNLSAPEHIVIDQAINVVALGAGLHTIMVPAGRVPWMNNNTPSWVRITLSERVSNKTLTAPGPIAYGDGRGFAQPFRTGETEDYLYYANSDANGGPDVDVALQGKVEKTSSASGTSGLSANAVDAGDLSLTYEKIEWVIAIENRGSHTATNVQVTFQKPAQLRDMEIILAKSGNEVAMEELHLIGPTVSFVIPRLLPGQSGEVVLGWYGCITCTTAALGAASASEAAAVDYTGTVTATVSGDKDTSNNTSSKTVRSPRLAPIVGSFMDYTDDSCMDRVIGGPAVSNKQAHTLRGRAEPNSIIAILIGLVKAGTATTDADGRFSYALNLPPGVHAVRAQYETTAALSATDAQIHRNWPPSALLLKVDTALPINPMSLCMIDSAGRPHAFPTFGLSFTYQKIEGLKPGTYTVTVQGGNDPNAQLQLKWGDTILALTDTDGDNTYTGQITIPAPNALSRASADGADAQGTLTLYANSSGTETAFSQPVDVSDEGKVVDLSTGQPLASAEVALLGGQPTDGDAAYAVLSAAEAGQPTPQVTGADGGFGYSATDGLYRLDIQRSGFQRYRSRAIDAGNETLNKNIALSPVINAGTTQVVYITANGYEPAAVNVYAGAVIEFVNLDIEEHSAAGASFDSGALAPGESYKVRLSAAGTFTYGEGEGNVTGAIVVAGGSRVLLPLVRR